MEDSKKEIELCKKCKDMKEKLCALYKELQVQPKEIGADEPDQKWNCSAGDRRSVFVAGNVFGEYKLQFGWRQKKVLNQILMRIGGPKLWICFGRRETSSSRCQPKIPKRNQNQDFSAGLALRKRLGN